MIKRGVFTLTLVNAQRPPDKIIAVNPLVKKYAEEQMSLDYVSSMVDEKHP